EAAARTEHPQRVIHGNVVAAEVVAPYEAKDVLEHERDADRRNGERERTAIAHGPERDAVDGEGDRAGPGQRPQPGDFERRVRTPVQHEGDVGADGEIRADGEVR